jgi:hypothetical protein
MFVSDQLAQQITLIVSPQEHVPPQELKQLVWHVSQQVL